MIKGFLIGLGSQIGADDVIGCYSETFSGLNTAWDAVNHALEGELMDLLIAAEMLGEAF